MPVLTSGRTRFDDAIIRREMRSALSLATTLDEISALIYDGSQFAKRQVVELPAGSPRRNGELQKLGDPKSPKRIIKRYVVITAINCAYTL